MNAFKVLLKVIYVMACMSQRIQAQQIMTISISNVSLDMPKILHNNSDWFVLVYVSNFGCCYVQQQKHEINQYANG
jgi:hypothetical protein